MKTFPLCSELNVSGNWRRDGWAAIETWFTEPLAPVGHGASWSLLALSVTGLLDVRLHTFYTLLGLVGVVSITRQQLSPLQTPWFLDILFIPWPKSSLPVGVLGLGSFVDWMCFIILVFFGLTFSTSTRPFSSKTIIVFSTEDMITAYHCAYHNF